MRARPLFAVLLVLAGVFCLGLSMGQLTGSVSLPDWLTRPPGPARDAMSTSQPTRIEIPSLSVRARVYPVGIAPDGAIAAPPLRRAHETGWYEDGPTPGQDGAAVIVGHVDDANGPAVFHGLINLRSGERIEVRRRDRQVVVFEVTDVRTYDKSALPADEVYGDFSQPELRLITCGGRWVGGDVGYADNVIVFATMITDQ